MPTTMIGAKEFGIICLKRFRIGLDPKAVEAVLNSRFFDSITALLAIRATLTQPNRTITRIIFHIDFVVLNIWRTTIAPRSIGKAKKMSVMRLRTASTQPPKKPAIAPIKEPTKTTKAVAIMPIVTEVRVPYITRA